MANLKFKRYLIDEEFDPETAERNTLHFVIVKQEPLVVNIFDVDSKGNVALVTGENIDAILDSKLSRAEFNQFLNTMIVPYTKNEVDTKLGLKLDKPTTISSTTTNYPFVVLVDDNNNSTKYQASDLGKNVANSALTSVTGAKLTLGADWEINVGTGFYFGLKGLLDKSADATWNRLLMADSSGRVAYTNGKNLIKGMPALLTEAERTTWKTEMNGGWTTNTMSVGIMSPSVVDVTKNENTWVMMKGAGLNLNPVNFTISIMSEDLSTVIAIIPNSQVQLYTNGIDLVFYYNFHTLPQANYKIRLWNGVATYNCPLTITVTDTINRLNLNTLVWEKMAITPSAVDTVLIANGQSVQYTSDPSNAVYASSEIPIASYKSSKIFEENENFYISFTLNTSGSVNLNNGTSGAYFLGLIANSTPLSLINSTICKIIIKAYRSGGYSGLYAYNDIITNLYTRSGIAQNINFTIVRKGSLYTSYIEYADLVGFYNHNGTTEALSFAGFMGNSDTAKGIGLVITEAYTF